MVTDNKAVQPAAALGVCRIMSVYNPVQRVAALADFRTAAELPNYHQPALNYPVVRLMHRLTDKSLMAVMTPRRGGVPVFIASVDPFAAQPEIAITHVPRPHVRELIAALRDNLKIENATILTTRDTAEGLEKEWGRDRLHTVRMHTNSWSWYQVKQPKPKAMDVPHGMAFEIQDIPQSHDENPATRFARLIGAGETQASISMQQLPGNRRFVLGDIAEKSVDGENGAVAPLFNHLIELSVQQQQSMGIILGTARPSLRVDLLGKHVCNCEAIYRKVDLGPKGSAPA